MKINSIKAKIFGLFALFAASIAVVSASDVQNYAELSTAVTNKEADITVTNNIGDYGAGLTIDYATAISSSVAGTVRTLSNPTAQTVLFNITAGTGNLTLTDIILNQASITGAESLVNNSGAFSATNATLSGAKTSALMNANAGNSVLTNVVLFGNSSNDFGGAINQQGTLNISASTLSNNTTISATSKGGALYIAGVNTTSTNNNYNSNGSVDGGAVYNTTQFNSTNDTYTKNTATNNGGAIYNTAGGTVTLSGSTFGDGTVANANTAVNGGAIANLGTLTTTNNTSFNKNTATNNGGAVYNEGTANIQAGTSFTANTATNNGGAVYNTGIYSSSNATYSNNNSEQMGGAIYNDVAGKVTIVGGNFVKNTSAQGGAIYNSVPVNAEANLIIDGATFGDGTVENQNSAVAGGAIYNTGLVTIGNTTATVNTTSFNNNSAALPDGGAGKYDGNGGAIANMGTINVNQNTSFTNNSAEISGGAIANTGTMVFANAGTFSGNSAFIGGAISNIKIESTVEGVPDVVGRISIANNSSFNNNTSLDGGGAIANDGVMIVGNNVTFSGNQSGAEGAAISNNGTLQLGEGLQFINNVAKETGGAIFTMTALNEVKSATFSGNKSNGEGGAVAFANYDMTKIQTSDGFTTSTNFTNNSARYDGGALYNNFASNITTISNTTFDSNKAGYNNAGVANTNGIGGAISNYGQIGNVSDSSFTNNNSTKFGGAIANVANLRYLYEVGYAESNIATISNNNFNANSSANGGAIYNENILDSIVNNVFTANTASEFGGAIYNNKNTYKLYNILPVTTSGVMVVSGSTFGDGTVANANKANNGGAIANTGKLTVTGNTTFNGNYAKTNGGAIYNTGELYLTPATGETITFKNNLSNYNEVTNTGNSNAIYNSGKVVLNGAGTVVIQDSVNGSGTIEKNGSGDFNVTALATTNPFIEQSTINFNKGNVNISGSSSQYAEVHADTLNMTAGTLNLAGKGQVDAVTNTLTPDAIVAVGLDNIVSGQSLIIGGSETKNLPLTVGDGVVESELFITPSNSGSAVINKYVNAVAKANGTLILDATSGNIVFENENVNGYSVKLESNGGLTLEGTSGNSIKLNNLVTSVDDTARLSILGTLVYDMDMDFSGASGVYHQSESTVNLSNKFFGAKAGSLIENNATLNLNEGAQIAEDYLTVNNATIAFNKNTLQAVQSAKFGTSAGNVVYGDSTITLNQANVIMNDGFVLTPDAEDNVTGKIEVGIGANAIKSLTLQNSTVATGTDFNLANGTVTLKDGTSVADDTTIAMDSSSVLNITNSADTMYIGSDIYGTGTINKTNAGAVKLSGNSSQFTGVYNQANGLTEFLSGSTYFGDGYTHNITGGEVKFNEGVNFTNTTPIEFTVKDSQIDVATIASTADLSTQKITVDPNKAVAMNLVNSGLAVNKYTTVKASSGNIKIGDDASGANTQLTNLSLGDTPYEGDSKVVTFTPSQNTSIVLQNPNNIANTGSLTLGDNVVFSAGSYDVSTQLGKNTELNLNVSLNAPLNNKTLNLGLKTDATSFATDNGKIIKGNNGTITLSGNNSGYHGIVQVNNGTIAVSDSSASIGSDSQYDLSYAESGAKISLSPIHNTSSNPDMRIIGVSLADNAVASVSNNAGSVQVTGNTTVDNNSVLTVNAANNVSLTNVLIGSDSDSSAGNVSVTAPTISFANTSSPVLVKGKNSTLSLNGETSVAQDLTIQHGTINLNGNMFVGGNFQMGSTVNMINNQINTQYIAGNMNLTENSDYKIDINGLTLQSDKVVVAGNITATNPGTKLDISAVNLIYEPKYQFTSYQVFNDSKTAAGQEIDPNVVFTSSSGIIGGAVGQYALLSGGNGSYTLARVGYNPYVLGGQVAAQAGYYTQLNSYNMAFANSDMVTALPRKEREAFLNANRYADADVENPIEPTDTATDVNINEKVVFAPELLPENNVGGWFRPYGIFENVKLKEGPEVGNNMYGTYFGTDSKIVDLKHGFKGSIGMYAGYDGSHQTFEGVGIYQNGGTIGMTGSLYKGDFFNLTTSNIGASGAEQSSILGNDNFWLLRGGIANKTGYNWDLFDGKFIIQPHLLMSISSVNLFSYKALHVASVEGESLFTYQLAPGFKFIGNLENGWQPYLSVDMIWNIGGKSHDKANGIALPEMYSEPWIEYGLGMQKRWGERFTGYGQAMFRNIGRNGVAFSAGMRLRVGEGR